MLVTHTVEPCRPTLVLADSLKSVRETLCVAQHAVNQLPDGYSAGGSALHHSELIGRLIAEIDRQRPLGPNGKHGELHTETCGCERPGLHCVHWHDGDACCRCGDPRDPDVCQACGGSDCPGCSGPTEQQQAEAMQELQRVAAFRRRLEEVWASTNNPHAHCPCGHAWGIHDVDEYRGDGTEMCCVTGCAQTGCPGRRDPKQGLVEGNS